MKLSLASIYSTEKAFSAYKMCSSHYFHIKIHLCACMSPLSILSFLIYTVDLHPLKNYILSIHVSIAGLIFLSSIVLSTPTNMYNVYP